VDAIHYYQFLNISKWKINIPEEPKISSLTPISIKEIKNNSIISKEKYVNSPKGLCSSKNNNDIKPFKNNNSIDFSKNDVFNGY